MCLSAVEHYCLGAYLYSEFTLLENPLAVGTYECQVTGLDAQLHGPGLTRSKFNLGKLTQTADIGRNTGYKVTAEQQDALLAAGGTGILNVNAELELILCREFGLVNLEV